MREPPSVKRKKLRKWVDQYWDVIVDHPELFEPKDSFFDGKFDEIKKQLGKKVSRPWPYDLTYNQLNKELLSYTKIFIYNIWFEVKKKEELSAKEIQKCRRALIRHYQSLITLKEKFPFFNSAPEIEKSLSFTIFLLEDVLSELGRRQLDKPLLRYIHALCSFYYNWTGKHAPSTIESKFFKFILYCIEALRLNGIWTDESVQEAIGEVIKRIPRHEGQRLL